VAAPSAIDNLKRHMDFHSFNLHADLLRGIHDLGFTRPTPIQHDAIPPALAGRDLIACAMTGSGKTAAFALPILQRLMARPRGATRALILTPTRELAAQVEEDIAALGKHTRVRGASVYGGVGMQPQESAIRRGVDIIVATPGRLLDHFRRPYGRFDSLEVLVLDEADRMLDMGFLPDIRRILAHLPRTPRQTFLFSATMPPPIVELAHDLLRDPATINLERKAAPATGVSHALYRVPAQRKTEVLLKLLQQDDVRSALAFTRTKHRADRLADFLDRRGIPSGLIHGDRSQGQRERALEGFKAGRYRVLVATDIAARGIDIEALSHVINFDVPRQPDDYIHRVGRTARAEATGDAITISSPEEDDLVRAIERAMGNRLPRVQVPGLTEEAVPPPVRFVVPIAGRVPVAGRRPGRARLLRRHR